MDAAATGTDEPDPSRTPMDGSPYTVSHPWAAPPMLWTFIGRPIRAGVMTPSHGQW